MSRRRSKNPHTAISITIPRTILDKIDNKLSATSSRSLWIATACHMRLEESALSLTDRQVFAAALARLPEGVMKDLLLEHILKL